MTGSIAGNNGGCFATDGNVYSPLWGGWLSNTLGRFLDVNGSDVIINPVSDLNNFGTGIALFGDSTANLPSSTWYLVIAGGGNGTNVQVAYELWNHRLTYHRYCAGGTWSEWVLTSGCISMYKNAASWFLPYGNIAVFRKEDDSDYGEVQASTFTKLSSKYAKDNIEDMTEEQASKILQLRSVNFDYKNGNKNQSGFIAEEVLKILPCCVSVPDNYVEDPNASEINLPRLDYSKFVPFLVKEIQVLNDRITKLEENK